MDATPQLIPMNKWMHNSTVKFFARNPDAVALSGHISLAWDPIVKIMARGFEIVCRDTFFITCRARQILSGNLSKKVYNEEEIFRAEKAINGQFDRLHEYFDTRLSQGEQKLEGVGLTLEQMQRTVKNYETKSVTNAVTQYLDLLAKADLYMTVLHYLWLSGELSDNSDEAMKVKLNAEREIRESLFSVTRFTSQHYAIVRRICNGVLEQRRIEREQQSERDRLRHQEEMAAAEAKAAKAKAKKNKGKNKSTGEAAVLAEAQKELASLSTATHQEPVPA